MCEGATCSRVATRRRCGKHSSCSGRQSTAIEPGNSLAHHWYAILLTTLDRRDEAVREIRRASELDPLSPALQGVKGEIEIYAGVQGSRKMAVDRTRLVDPTHPGTIGSR